MQNVQNAVKVMQKKQGKDCKIGLINIQEKIVNLTFQDTPSKIITKMFPETISKFLEMDIKR